VNASNSNVGLFLVCTLLFYFHAIVLVQRKKSRMKKWECADFLTTDPDFQKCYEQYCLRRLHKRKKKG
jgi:hypothetical protein